MKLIRVSGKKEKPEIFETPSQAEFVSQMNSILEIGNTPARFRFNRFRLIEEVGADGRVIAVYFPYASRIQTVESGGWIQSGSVTIELKQCGSSEDRFYQNPAFALQ